MLKIGHRGAKGYVAENTLESIQKALNLGVDGVEIDVHRCASGELVVFHDFTVDRMTNGSGEISKYSLQELKQLKVNHEYDIPTLEAVLDLLNKTHIINIEMKGANTASETCRIIKKYIEIHGWKYSNFILSSFQRKELEDVFKIDTNITLAVLTKASVEEAVGLAKIIKAKYIHPDYTLLTMENVKQAQAKGFKVNTWTVNDEADILRMKYYGVDGIISDVPDRL